MWRKLLKIAAGVSLLLNVAVAALWIRSYLCCDEVIYRGETRATMVLSYDGNFYFVTRGEK